MTKPISGAGGGGKGGGGSQRAPIESKDSLRSKAYAKVLDVICEGEIEGLVDGMKSVYLDGTPLQNPDGTYNFNSVEIETRNGSQSQSYIPGFSAVENTVQVNVEAKKATSVTRQLTNANIDAVRVTIGIPNLSYQDDKTGDLGGTTVQYAIDVQSNGGGYVPQVLGQAWLETGLSQISHGYFRTTGSDTRGIRILTHKSITNSGFRMEYRLVGSATWLTAGVTYTGSKKLSGGDNTFQTPQLNSGQWEARIVTTAGAAPPTTYTYTTTSWNDSTITQTDAITFEAERLTGTPYETITGKTTTRYQRSHLIRLTGSPPWDVRVRRITDDSTTVRKQDQTWWDAYTEVIEAKLRYPNSALVGIRVDSSQFQNIPTRGYDAKLLRVRVPSNYNPTTRAYTGSWNGSFKIAWTDNPAWCFYDLVTSDRYGLGGMLSDAQVDKWALYQIGKYCDELVPDGLGGTEPRFTCNLYLQTRQEAYKVLQDFASIFRGMVYWATGAVTAVQDAPSDPVALFTAANVIDGRFNYSGSGLKARHTVALVSWNDPDDLYRQKVEYVEDAEAIARYGVQQAEVVAVGCTSRGQANRVGRWLLYSERYETETVQFSVGLSGAVVRPGNIIKVADATRASARLGGRVVSATTTSVTVDKAPALSVTGWTLYVMLPDGTVQERTVSSKAGDKLNVGTAFTVAPGAQSIWILSANTVQAQTFRVVGVAEDAETGNYAITALKHEPLKYDAIEQGLKLQPRDITLLNNVPAAPTGLVLSESLYLYQSEVRSKLNVGWADAENVYRYIVEWRFASGVWKRETVRASEFEVLNTTPGLYEFKIYTSNPAGKLSATALTGSINALGKTAPPANVTGFSNYIDQNIGVTLTWDRGTDLDLDGYEVRSGTSWAAGTSLGQVKGTTLKVGLPAAGTTYYWIKAIDTSGSMSTTAASTSVTVTAAAAPTVSASFAGDSVVLTWTAVSGDLATESYEIRYGSSFAAGTSLGTIKGTSFTAKAKWSGDRKFWVRAVDLAGNPGAAGYYTATVNVPVSVTMTQEVIDNNVLLKWGDATATLPIDYYELRRGSTWAGATVIGRVSARFSAIFETVAGTFTYWVAGYDVAGNPGATSQVSALVNQPPDYTLQYNLDSDFTGTKTNMVFDVDGKLLAPVNTTETWEGHFTSRSWTSPQSQVTALYPIYVQPSNGSGSYEEIVDYGTVLAATKIKATLTYSGVSGSTTVTPTLSVRKLTTDPWTDYAGVSSAFVSDFRYAKIRYDFSSTGGDDIIAITGLNIRFDVKLKNDAGKLSVFPSQAATYAQSGTTITVTFTAHGRVTGQRVSMDFTSGTATDGDYVITSHTANTFTVTSATSATTSGNVTLDGTGTPALFSTSFVDVQSITLSPGGTSASIAVYNFVDAPNPTGFKVLLFNTAGTRIAGTVGWSAKGV